jgi:hypothetical protein
MTGSEVFASGWIIVTLLSGGLPAAPDLAFDTEAKCKAYIDRAYTAADAKDFQLVCVKVEAKG